MQMLAMEDFCQLENRLTSDKYKGSYERCAKVVMNYSQNAGLDVADLFLRIVFSFAIGNSDMHLKNFSLIETAEGNSVYQLSDAYDMDELAQLSAEIQLTISRLDNADYRVILYKRYIESEAWQDIAMTMGYSERQIYRFHAAALNELVVPA